MALMYIPRQRSPWEQMLPGFLQNLMFNQMAAKRQDAHVLAQQQLAEKKLQETRLYNEELARRTRTSQLSAAGHEEMPIELGQTSPAGGTPEGFWLDPVTKTEWKRKPSSLQRKTKYFIQNGQTHAQDYNYDPRKGTLTPISKPYLSKAPGTSTTSVNVKVGQSAMTKLGEEMSKALVEEHKAARGAVSGLQNLKQGYQLLNSGAITGFGAKWLVGAGKMLQRLGVNIYDNPIANTEAYQAQMGRQVGEIIKQFGAGTGLSDADREYAEKIAGGDIGASEKALRKIIAINAKAYRNVIKNYNKRAGEAMKRPGAEQLPYNLMLEMPPKFSTKKIIRTGTHNGRTVIEYEDGTVEYAD